MEKQIKALAPKVETRLIQVDFSGLNTVAQYKDLVAKCADLDVSIVVVNAGIMIVGDFENFPSEASQSMMDVNAYQYAMLHRLFMDKLKRRIET